MAKYSFNCPAGDGHVTVVEAKTEEEAMKKMLEEGKKHASEVHADQPAMSDEDMMNMVKAGWTKED